jgi:hypothetical protein
MMMRCSLCLVALAGIVACASAGSGGPATASTRSRCALTNRDSTYLARGPVYRDCAVDDKAQLITNNTRFDFQPAASDNGCLAAEVEFVVDTLGKPEMGSVQVVRATTRAFGDAVAAAVPSFLYQPARVAGVRVRQIVSERRSVIVGRVVVPMGSAPPSRGSAPRAPTC